jgi:hypothetical protein
MAPAYPGTAGNWRAFMRCGILFVKFDSDHGELALAILSEAKVGGSTQRRLL